MAAPRIVKRAAGLVVVNLDDGWFPGRLLIA
jgi:hypothetical protein